MFRETDTEELIADALCFDADEQRAMDNEDRELDREMAMIEGVQDNE